MPEAAQAIQVTAGSDRPSQRTQIEEALARARKQGDKFRVRIPVMLYDHAPSRAYTVLRDATWNLTLPVQQISAETVEELIGALGECIIAIARDGSHAVLERLGGHHESENVYQEDGTEG